MECSAELCAPEPVRTADRGGDRTMVYEANLWLCLRAGVRNDSAAGRGGHIAAREALDQGRGHRTAVLLRLSLGSNSVPGATAGALEDTPSDTHRDPGETGYLCVRAPANGAGSISRRTPADPAHCAGRVDSRGLRL